MPAFNHFANKIRTYLEFLRDRSLIARSGLFDRAWYLSNYADVAQLKGDAASHYLRHGGVEGRDPGPGFSSRWYLDAYPDVKSAGQNPLVHYLRFGQKEGRKANNRVVMLEDRLSILEDRLEDVETTLAQLQSIIKRETNIPLPPPKHLQVRVVDVYSPDFIESGFTSVYPALNCALAPSGKELKDFETILDFGCGCGRAIRALATLLPNSKLYGTDIDAEAIDWLEKNYSRYGRFAVAPPLPPTSYPDKTFDLVFGISVFTHLPEDMQFRWLDELSRITKPGGYLILTTHGEKYYKNMGAEVIRIMEQKGFHYCTHGFNYGQSINLPDFYQSAYHTHDYIRREWGKFFDIIHIQHLGIDNHQDTILLRNNSR